MEHQNTGIFNEIVLKLISVFQYKCIIYIYILFKLNLIEAGRKYITTLLNLKHTWVKCFTSRHFTAGTQSTQRVELENALIQKAVQSSFSLLQVQESLENRLKFESINNDRYSIWKALTLQYTQPFVIQTFFSGIDDIMKKYLTQPIHDAHYKQMCQSICYRAYQISFSEISVSDDDSFEPFLIKKWMILMKLLLKLMKIRNLI